MHVHVQVHVHVHVHAELDTRSVTVCIEYGCTLRYMWSQLDEEDCKVRLEQLKSGAASDDAQVRAAAACRREPSP